MDVQQRRCSHANMVNTYPGVCFDLGLLWRVRNWYIPGAFSGMITVTADS